MGNVEWILPAAYRRASSLTFAQLWSREYRGLRNLYVTCETVLQHTYRSSGGRMDIGRVAMLKYLFVIGVSFVIISLSG